ncbi:hypothetical protein [Micromonospora sp. NPDC050200]|uniref:hypothetical protein n=1 Tax=Micromonospora sp. NPDC050200 TaxID=3155664 RepID=UPI0033E72023
MTTLTLRRTGRRWWTLTTATGAPRGTLRTGRGLGCAEATAADGTWPARAHGRRRLRVTAGPPGAVALELDPPLARLPGRDVPARWETPRGFRRYGALLTDTSGRVAARTSPRPGAPVRSR